MLAVLYQPKA